MTRRHSLGLLALPAAAQFQTNAELEAEFFDLTRKFIISWNKVTEQILLSKWDYKVAGECEKAFRKLTEHPMWLKVKK